MHLILFKFICTRTNKLIYFSLLTFRLYSELLFFFFDTATHEGHTKCLLNIFEAQNRKLLNRWTDALDAVCTLESGAPNCRTYTAAIGSYGSLSARCQNFRCCAGKIESLSKFVSFYDSATAAATASSSTLTLNARCEGRGKLYKLVASDSANVCSD